MPRTRTDHRRGNTDYAIAHRHLCARGCLHYGSVRHVCVVEWDVPWRVGVRPECTIKSSPAVVCLAVIRPAPDLGRGRLRTRARKPGRQNA